MAGRLVEKTAMEIQEERSQGEDEITMKEMQRIADNIIKHIETEYDCPSQHPELEFKVSVRDLAMWVEEIDIAAPAILPDFQNCYPFSNLLTHFQIFDPFSKCWHIFKNFSYFQIFAQLSSFCPIFKILTHFQNFDPFSK